MTSFTDTGKLRTTDLFGARIAYTASAPLPNSDPIEIEIKGGNVTVR